MFGCRSIVVFYAFVRTFAKPSPPPVPRAGAPNCTRDKKVAPIWNGGRILSFKLRGIGNSQIGKCLGGRKKSIGLIKAALIFKSRGRGILKGF